MKGAMKDLRFDSYKTGNSFPLQKMAAYFDLPASSRRREYIVLEGRMLRLFAGIQSDRGMAFVFRFGCFTLVDFTPGEAQRFLEAMRTAFGFGDRLQEHETYTLRADSEEEFRIFEDSPPVSYGAFTVPTLANALAKLSALSFMEKSIGITFDEAEHFIRRFRHGKLNFRAIRYAKEIARIIRFQYSNAYTVRIFERCDVADAHIDARRLYDTFMEHYEYTDRIHVLRQKTDALDGIFKLLLPLGTNWQESGELYVEIALLALFPLFYLL